MSIADWSVGLVKLRLLKIVNNMELVNSVHKLFNRAKPVILGMIHLQALPGTPRSTHSVKEIIEKARLEACMYKDAGLDAVLVENMHDVPYLHTGQVGPEVVACMTAACREVHMVFDTGPVGVQILAGANQQALAVALAAGLDFIRAEGFVFSHVADEGWMDACAGPLLRYRKHIGAEHISIFTDIKKKHSAHTVTADVSITETAKAAQYFLSDGLILTGGSTAEPASVQELQEVLKSVQIPVLIGSGVTSENLQEYKAANGLIVGSHFKKDGHWANEIDQERLTRFMRNVRKIRGTG